MFNIRQPLPYLLFIFLLIGTSGFAQNQTPNPNFPKIGLVLSGGGAKGLAHITALKALDSAGLKVDYIAGTSIGSIVGGVYAAGYSGKQIESIARQIKWGDILTDKVPLDMLAIEQKDMNASYALKMPIKNGVITIENSFMEGQGIWNEFNQIMFPVLNVKDFSQLAIPFVSIATNLSLGKEVILNKGNIVESMRASMAVPIVFSPIIIDSTVLVDGGVVKNFPVDEVINMGANYVIGMELNKGGYVDTKFDDPGNIIDAIAFYKTAETYQEQKSKCDFYYLFDPGKYTSGDFFYSKEIMDRAETQLDSLYHSFVAIRQELEAKYGPANKSTATLPQRNTYKIVQIKVVGLNEYETNSFKQLAGMEMNRPYNKKEIQKIVDEVFSSNRFKSVHYNINNLPDDTYEIEFQVIPKANTYVNLGLQYSNFEGINVIGLINWYALTSRQSKTDLGMSLGKNFRFKFSHLQPLTKYRKFAIRPHINWEFVDLLNVDQNNNTNATYRQKYRAYGIDLVTIGNDKYQVGVRWEQRNIQISPDFYLNYTIKGKNNLSTAGAFFEYNSLNKTDFASRGLHLTANFDYVYKQKHNLEVSSRDGKPVDLNALGLRFAPYERFNLLADYYIPLKSRWVLNPRIQSDINFNYQQNFVDNYQIGGLMKTFRNQIPFVGLYESNITTSSFGGIMLNLNYVLTRNVSLISTVNWGKYDIIKTQNLLNDSSLFGMAASINYLTKLGPLRFSVSYTPRNQSFQTYVYIGNLF